MAGASSRPFDLNYWSMDRDESSAEVDFYFQHRSRLVGMDIKPGNVSQMKSLFSLGKIDPSVSLVWVSWVDLINETWNYSGK